MNFLADESCAASVIRALREAGHNVLTEDLDFGNLVFARGLSAVGVILIRFRAQARRAKPATVVEAVSRFGSRLRNAFVVVEPGRVRISPRS